MIRIYLGLTVFLTLSVDIAHALFQSGNGSWLRWMPSGFENLIIAAVIVGAFMLLTRIAARIPAARPGKAAFAVGIIGYVVVQMLAGAVYFRSLQGLTPTPHGLFILLAWVTTFLQPLMVVVHGILFVGAYRLMANLASPATT